MQERRGERSEQIKRNEHKDLPKIELVLLRQVKICSDTDDVLPHDLIFLSYCRTNAVAHVKLRWPKH